MAGNAFCLHDDLARAWEIYPDAPVIAVNGASRETNAIALYSSHPERMVQHGFEWLRHQRRLFGETTVHASAFVPDCPHVEYWWEDARGAGGSAWGARKLAWLLGFDPVVLCGCPLDPGPYVGGHNIGGFMSRRDVVDGFRGDIEADTGWHEGVTSMSGWTRDFLC